MVKMAVGHAYRLTRPITDHLHADGFVKRAGRDSTCIVQVTASDDDEDELVDRWVLVPVPETDSKVSAGTEVVG